MNKKKRKNLIMIIIDVLVLLLVFYFILGYANFYNLSKEKDPIYVVKEKSYNTNNGKVDVYDNIVYKIVRYEVTGKNVSYSLRLWFMTDI